jgi:hypothetical protein
MRLFVLLVSLLLSAHLLTARTWKSASSDKSFDASYVSNDGKLVTLRKGGRILTFSIAKLHADDQAWLKANHPTKEKGKGVNKTTTAAPRGAAFDTLEFGDSRKEVVGKLSASPNVISSVPAAMTARVGLNGTFKTKPNNRRSPLLSSTLTGTITPNSKKSPFGQKEDHSTHIVEHSATTGPS